MYATRSGLILGFHGCDESIVNDVLTGKKSLEPSTNQYDWLGHGVYFWDNSPARALEFSTYLKNNPGKAKRPISKPAVLGAIINLGYCLDLLDYGNLQFLKEDHDLLTSSYSAANIPVPKNRPVGTTKDLLLRELDCAVIETFTPSAERFGAYSI
jgi:hypothetical protein